MTISDKVFEGGRRLSIVISILWFVGYLIPVGLSAKEVWDDHKAKVLLREDFWKFAEKQTDGLGPWTIFRFEDTRGWRKMVEPDELEELRLNFPKDLETDLKELRGRSWKRFAEMAEAPLWVGLLGVIGIFAIRKATGWVVRGFVGEEDRRSEPKVEVPIDGDDWTQGWLAGAMGEPPKSGASLSFLSGFIEGKAEREHAEWKGRPIRLPRRSP